jgi:hypothetical protein
MGFVITEDYDSEALASDIANVAGDMWNVEVGEMFDRDRGSRLGADSHAFSVVTPSERKFLVTVTEVEGTH